MLRAALLPELRFAPRWVKECGVETAGENAQLFRGDAALNPCAAVAFAVNVNHIERVVEPLHVAPGKRLEERILREDANVLRKIGLIDAARAQAEHLGGE